MEHSIQSKYIFGLEESHYGKVHNQVDLGIELSLSDKIEKKCGYPVNIIIALDTSLSMAKDNKIACALASADYLIGHLNPEDTIDLITFSGEVKPYSDQFIKLTDQNKDKLRKYLRSIYVSGNTNFEKLFDYLSKRLSKIENSPEMGLGPMVTAIMFLTDGILPENLSNKELFTEFKKRISPLVRNDIFIYAFGYGLNHNAELLSKIALIDGQGLYYYIPNSKFIGGILEIAISNLKNIIANDIKIYLKANKGTRIQAITNTKQEKNAIKQIEESKEYVVDSNYLLYNEKLILLLKISINKVENICEQNLLDVQIGYFDTFDQVQKTINMKGLMLRRTIKNINNRELSCELENYIYRMNITKIIKEAIKISKRKNGISESINYIDKKIEEYKSKNSANYFNNLIEDLEICKRYLSELIYPPVYSVYTTHYTGINTGLDKETIEFLGGGKNLETLISRYPSSGDLENEKMACLEIIAGIQKYF